MESTAACNNCGYRYGIGLILKLERDAYALLELELDELAERVGWRERFVDPHCSKLGWLIATRCP